jgi:hypothetical protein
VSLGHVDTMTPGSRQLNRVLVRWEALPIPRPNRLPPEPSINQRDYLDTISVQGELLLRAFLLLTEKRREGHYPTVRVDGCVAPGALTASQPVRHQHPVRRLQLVNHPLLVRLWRGEEVGSLQVEGVHPLRIAKRRGVRLQRTPQAMGRTPYRLVVRDLSSSALQGACVE